MATTDQQMQLKDAMARAKQVNNFYVFFTSIL